MSMVICERCDAPIDSDADPGCFVETGNMRRLHETTIMCESCRERAYDRQQEDLAQDGAGPTLLERQQAAYKIKHGLP
jgi:ribosomal protein L37E